MTFPSREKSINEKSFLEGNTMKAAVISRINKDTKICYYSTFSFKTEQIFSISKMGGKIKRNMNIVCSYSHSGLCICFKRQYLTPISLMNVVLNSKEIPKSKSHSCLPLGSEVSQSPAGTRICSQPSRCFWPRHLCCCWE